MQSFCGPSVDDSSRSNDFGAEDSRRSCATMAARAMPAAALQTAVGDAKRVTGRGVFVRARGNRFRVRAMRAISWRRVVRTKSREEPTDAILEKWARRVGSLERMSSVQECTRLRAWVGFAQETGVGIEETGRWGVGRGRAGKGGWNWAWRASRCSTRRFRVLRRARRAEVVEGDNIVGGVGRGGGKGEGEGEEEEESR